jgi:uncharacterized membrane protein
MTAQVPLWTVALVLFCAVLGAFGQFLFKLGSASLTSNVASWLTNWRILLGMALYGISAVLFIVALRRGNLSLLYPLVATSYIWVTLLATGYLGEPFPPLKWLGIALIIGGVSLIAR